MDIKEISKKAAPVMHSYGVARASVFGSAARGTAGPKSDIDILVRFKKPPGMIEYIQFIEKMRGALDQPVDVVTERSATYLKPHIEHDLQTIYES